MPFFILTRRRCALVLALVSPLMAGLAAASSGEALPGKKQYQLWLTPPASLMQAPGAQGVMSDGPALYASPAQLDLGWSRQASVEHRAQLHLSNTGDRMLRSLRIESSREQIRVDATDCPQDLEPGAYCVVSVYGKNPQPDSTMAGWITIYTQELFPFEVPTYMQAAPREEPVLLDPAPALAPKVESFKIPVEPESDAMQAPRDGPGAVPVIRPGGSGNKTKWARGPLSAGRG